VSFEDALARHGFEAAENRESHVLYRSEPNRFLTWQVHAYHDGTALLTWEFAVVDYLGTKGIVLGSSEALNTFMFPATDETGPQEEAWLTSVLDRAEALLESLDFAHPEG